MENKESKEKTLREDVLKKVSGGSTEMSEYESLVSDFSEEDFSKTECSWAKIIK